MNRYGLREELQSAQGAVANYTSYLQLDTLLRLQTPASSIPEERAFIAFHQMTELAFSLILDELEWLTEKARAGASWQPRLRRICALVRLASFQMRMLTETLDPGAFLAFRSALGEASGMQSLQYRKIELMSTRLICLVPEVRRAGLRDTDCALLFDNLYWRAASGACPMQGSRADGDDEMALRELAFRMRDCNLAARYAGLLESERADIGLRNGLAEFDRLFNRTWGLLHLRCAEVMLKGGRRGTGGTDWRPFLEDGLARRFFPELRDCDG